MTEQLIIAGNAYHSRLLVGMGKHKDFKAVEVGRDTYLAGRTPKQLYSASPSSPTTGMIG